MDLRLLPIGPGALYGLLYALVEIDLINGLDIDVVKVSTCFNVSIPSVCDRATGGLACSACHC